MKDPLSFRATLPTSNGDSILINSGIALCFWLFASFVALVFFWKRWHWRHNKSRGKRHLGYYPNAAALGNALQILQALTQPHVEHILEQKLAEPTDDEDSGGPDLPTSHLHRQAQQIRRGTPPDRMTAHLPRNRGGNPA
jgi:hypothetical protein